MTKSWVEELPTITLSNFLGIMMLEKSIPAMRKNVPADLWHYNKILQKVIQKTGAEILRASTGDDVVRAEARLRLFRGEQEKVSARVQDAAVGLFLQAGISCAAYLGGEKVIVPAHAWSGEMDWNKETLVFEKQRYSHLSVIFPQILTQEQKRLVEKYAQKDIATVKPALPPGRPTFMHIIDVEFQRRKNSGLTEELISTESEHLEIWFKKHHPDKKSVKAKTIANHLRKDFREHKSKSA